MTSATLTRLFIGGATARTPFMGMSEGRIRLVNGEMMSPEDLVTPILRDCYSNDSNQGLVVSVNDSGIRHRIFRSILTENSKFFEQGERRIDCFGKMTLSALLGWLDVAPRGASCDVATCALQLFPRESALLPLPSVSSSRASLLRKRDGKLSVHGQWLYFGGSWTPEWQNLLDEERGK